MPEENSVFRLYDNVYFDIPRRHFNTDGQPINANEEATRINDRDIISVNVPLERFETPVEFEYVDIENINRRRAERLMHRPSSALFEVANSSDEDNNISSDYLTVGGFKFTDEQYDFLYNIIHEIIFNRKITLRYISQLIYSVYTYGGHYSSGTMHRKNITLFIKELISNGCFEFIDVIKGLNRYSSKNKRIIRYILNFVNSKLTTRIIKFDLAKIEWAHTINPDIFKKVKEKYKIYYSYMYQKELCKYQNECQMKCSKYYNELKELIISRRSENNIKTYKKYNRVPSALLKLNKEYYIVYQLSPHTMSNKMAKIEGMTFNKKGICNGTCNKKIIHPYNEKPKVKFLSSNNDENFYFGIELECISKTKNKKKIINLCNKNKFVQIVKHDGSLSKRYGVEIVTHPMSLEYYEQNFKTFLNDLKQITRVNYQCGTHIHFNKSYLGDEHLDTTRYYLEKLLRSNIKLLEKFCDRTCGDYCYYNNHKREEYFGRSESKYEFINFLPQDTVEFRLLSGTLDYDKILKTITMLKYVADIAKENILFEDKKIKVQNFLLSLLKVNNNDTICQYAYDTIRHRR